MSENCLSCAFCVVSEYCTGSSLTDGGLYDCAWDQHVILRPELEWCPSWCEGQGRPSVFPRALIDKNGETGEVDDERA